MSSHRMRSLLFGSQIDWSAQLRWTKRRHRKMQRQTLKQITYGLQKMKLHEPPKERVTWTKIHHLVKEAKDLILNQGKPLTPCMYFIAFLALISGTPPVEGAAFWAYVPRPPLLQPVSWFDPEPIKILTNDTLRLGGLQDSDVRPNSSSYITFEGRTDTLPICITLQGRVPDGCVKVSYRTFLTDAPDSQNPGKRWMWEIQIQTLGHPSYNETFQSVKFMPIPACIQEYRDLDQS